MIKELNLKGKIIKYELQYKNVKNINFRIKPDCSIFVSANKKVSITAIEEFIVSKGEFILKALDKYENRVVIPVEPQFSEKEVISIILDMCEKVYPYYEKRGIEYPQIKFRKMKSRWGSCHSTKGILTFNTELKYAPLKCIEYVVWHEFTHFLQPNHSAKFYAELEKVMPDWKGYRKRLKGISLGGTV